MKTTKSHGKGWQEPPTKVNRKGKIVAARHSEVAITSTPTNTIAQPLTPYTMPVRAIKNILAKELESFKDGFFEAYPTFIMSDHQKEFVYIAYGILKNKLESCNTYEELDEYITFAGYRMSLTEWIESL